MRGISEKEKTVKIVDRFPRYFDYDYMVLGSFAYSSRKERFILDDYATEYDGKVETPGYHFNKILQEVRLPKQGNNDTLSYPYKAIPSKYPYGFYVDISKAYYQIAQVYGINCAYKEGLYFAYGDYLPVPLMRDNKLVRALLVGGTSKFSTITEWKDNDISKRHYVNRNYAPHLRGAIMHTLHALQASISSYTAYCHTDGFIIPYWHMETVDAILGGYGFEYSIKGEGVTSIMGVGSYTVGRHATRTHHTGHKPKTFIRSEYSDWWLRNFYRGKERQR